MSFILLLTFIAVPLLELAVLIKVGGWLGFWPTLTIVVLTFFAGATIVARSGFAAALRLQEAMAKGEPPAPAMIESTLFMLSGVLLMTPGFIADCVGLVLLVPPVRRLVAAYAAGRLFGTPWAHRGPPGGPGQRSDPHEPSASGGASDGHGPVIEGEFERLDERPVDPRRRRPPPEE